MGYVYATGAEFRQWGSELEDRGRVVLAKAERRSVEHSTFLSHSSKDVDILPGVIRILENHGAAVYVDKKDTSLPPYTSRETASALRGRIERSKKFILLASANSKDSRWVPWELGLADGFKKPKNVAIFPSVDKQSETSWTEQEYLGIYDRIVWGDLQGYDKRIWMVLNQEKNEAIPLSVWIGL
jgi:TIR domain